MFVFILKKLWRKANCWGELFSWLKPWYNLLKKSEWLQTFSQHWKKKETLTRSSTFDVNQSAKTSWSTQLMEREYLRISEVPNVWERSVGNLTRVYPNKVAIFHWLCITRAQTCPFRIQTFLKYNKNCVRLQQGTSTLVKLILTMKTMVSTHKISI